MPDANKEHTINQLVGAAFGAAGQRCMALSTAVFVGEARNWIPEIVERARKLQVNEGLQAGADLGPLISPEAKQRVHDLIQSGVDEGAKVSPSPSPTPLTSALAVADAGWPWCGNPQLRERELCCTHCSSRCVYRYEMLY